MLSVLDNQRTTDRDEDNPAAYAIGHGFENDEAMIADFEQRFGVTVLEAYGITPTATLATSNQPDDRRLGSVGKPVRNAEIKIVDGDDWEVPAGESGEILVRPMETNTMLQGFFEAPELTADRCRNQWIHTNDVGYVDEDGYLYFVASKTNTIHLGRIAGRISSLEIESVIESHPDVRESVVIGIRNDDGREDIKAVVVPTEGAGLGPVEISEYCERRLTYYKLPRYVEIREEIPRSAAGKVRKAELRDVSSADIWSRDGGYELLR
jgi:acyl-CoA synthetase (AMP-forming)/AMP-acid ligase II